MIKQLSISSPIINLVGFFLCLKFSRHAMTNKQLYDSYHAKDSTDALKAHRLKTRRDRARNGSKKAAEYVDKIEQSLISR